MHAAHPARTKNNQLASQTGLQLWMHQLTILSCHRSCFVACMCDNKTHSQGGCCCPPSSINGSRRCGHGRLRPASRAAVQVAREQQLLLVRHELAPRRRVGVDLLAEEVVPACRQHDSDRRLGLKPGSKRRNMHVACPAPSPQQVPALITTGPSLLVGSSVCVRKSHVAMSKSTCAGGASTTIRLSLSFRQRSTSERAHPAPCCTPPPHLHHGRLCQRQRPLALQLDAPAQPDVNVHVRG